MLGAFIYVFMTFKPVHLVWHDKQGNEILNSCGAGERLMKENVKVFLNTREGEAKVNYMEWEITGNEDGVVTIQYHAQPDSYMYTDMIIEGDVAYYSIVGIDKNRVPCMDTVFMKKI